MPPAFCHVVPAASFSVNLLRKRRNDFPGREAARQIPRHPGDQGDLPILLHRTQNHDPRTELVTEIVDQRAQLPAVQRVNPLSKHLDTFHHDRLAGSRNRAQTSSAPDQARGAAS